MEAGVPAGDIDNVAPNIGAEYEIIIRGADGNEKRRFGGKANCFVKGFMDYLYHMVRNGGVGVLSTPFTTTSGSAVSSTLCTAGSASLFLGGARANAGVNDIIRGIVLGRSGIPVALTDYNVGDIIGTSELYYDSEVFSELRYDGIAAIIETSRMVSNQGEVAVAGIRAIAMYVTGTCTGNACGDISFMILRDVVPEFSLQPRESAVVVYRIIFNGGV